MKLCLSTLSIALATTLALTACGGGDSPMPRANGGPPMIVDADGVSTFDATALGASLTALPVELLSTAEQATLIYMREEEKLAHDVYAQFNTQYAANTRVFGNIATSETTHTESIRQLLVRYTLADPAATTAPGVFQNATLQGLYTQLVAAGTVSYVDGLKVGAAIEELDMIDINTALLQVDNQDIRLVYDNLLKGSRNHLRSFVKTLANQGITYVPQYMAVADYTAIVTTAIER
jgi:hypothetical protein